MNNNKPSIILSDFRDYLPEIEDRSVDLLLTDPPYSTELDDIESFVSDWLNPVLEKLADTGQGYIFTGSYYEEMMAYLNHLSTGQGKRFTKQVLVWEYRNTIGPESKKRYHQNWQAILYLRGTEAPPINTHNLVEKFAVQRFNAPDGRSGVRYHRWEKPLDLAKQLIRHGSQPGDLVFDPFAGTGTFLIAAVELGRRNIGTEIDPEMVKIARKRKVSKRVVEVFGGSEGSRIGT